MKINYDYYTGKDIYCDGEVEKTIINYMDKCEEKDYEKIFENDISWPVFYHLSPIRQNIINWYPFKKNATVLEIGGGMGAITGALCDKAQKVVTVELSKQRASAIAKRHNDRDNLEILVGNLNDIKFEEKFDYITLIGVFEYAGSFTNDEKPYHKFLENIKKLLKPDGKILIAIENKFGLKYFAGSPEDHTNIMFDSITGYKSTNKIRTFGKEEIKSILKEAGLEHNNFYYPLPDYKLPNVIFSDSCLPDENNINTYLPYYYENSDILFNEVDVYKEIIKENKEQFGFFSSSFFIECSSEEINNDVETVVFDSYNKIEFRNMSINEIPKNNIIDNIDFESDKINTCMYNFWSRKYNDIFNERKKNISIIEEMNKELIIINKNFNEVIVEKEVLFNELLSERDILFNKLNNIENSKKYKMLNWSSNLYKKIFMKN